MESLKPFFYRLPSTIAASVRGHRLLWHGLAIALTYVLVTMGVDWRYVESTRSPLIFALSLPAALLGFVVPIALPLILFLLGRSRGNITVLNTGYALAQSGAVAWIISSSYKALTGRAHPELFAGSATLVDRTREFHFGFFRGGILWGWPSSHTTVAFAMATTIMMLFPKTKTSTAALIFAFYIGLGASTTIHWLSDCVAGAIFGAVIGTAVGEAFRARDASLLVAKSLPHSRFS